MTNLLAVLSLGIFSTIALATQTATLDRDSLQVKNALGEDVLVERVALTPSKVKISMNPRVEYSDVCVKQGIRNECGYDAFHCGFDSSNPGPRWCCWTTQECTQYDRVPQDVYTDFTLDFHDCQPLDSASKDIIDLVPSSNGQSLDVKIVNSQRPYTVKQGGVFSKRTYFFSQGK